MAIRFSPFGNSPLYLPNLAPASGYKLYIYQAGSATKTAVYADVGGTPQSNPVILDANGWPTNTIYLSDVTNYRFVYAHPLDSDPPTTQITPPIDHVALVVPSAQATVNEWVAGPTPTFLSATQFSVPGVVTGTFHPGRRVQAIHSGGGTIYGTISASSFASVTTVTIIPDSGVLDSSLVSVNYGFMAAQDSAWPGGKNNGLTTQFLGPVVVDLNEHFGAIPAGTVLAYAGQVTIPPPGYLLTNGGSYSDVTFPNLGAALPFSHTSANQFNVPTIANLQTNVRYIIRHS